MHAGRLSEPIDGLGGLNPAERAALPTRKEQSAVSGRGRLATRAWRW
jgi:hypothetical protein